MKNYFNEKVVWITGASSGIGAEVARQLSPCKVKLILSARNEEKLNKVKQECETLGAEAKILPLDLMKTEELEEKALQAIKMYGKVDFFFSNGGQTQRSYIQETELTVDRQIMEVNYFSGVILTKQLLPHMLENGFGHIISTSSIAGCFGFTLRSAYSAAKHAMYGFYEALHAELSPQNIHSTIVAPGRIHTELSKSALTKDGQLYGKMDKGQNDGMSTTVMVRRLLKAVKKQRVEVLIGGKEIIMVYIRRYVPKLFYKIVTKIKPT